MFFDEVKVWIRAGDGGDGAATFRHEAHVPRGGPDGGDGGRGGSIYLTVDAGETSLRDYRHSHHFKASSGGRGSGQRMHGKAGTDLVLKVPPGTGVFDGSTGELLGDLVASEQTLMVARGGRGGLGNVHFATSTHQAPKHAQMGEPGEERQIRLELRLIADVGLVGLPNAGKSTLLAALTAARPKIADYPFTTLHPGLGVVAVDGREFVLADIPGLIEGAHEGLGLGDRFLGHVERCRVLLHLVDGTCEHAGKAYKVVRGELEAYGHGLPEKHEVVALTKIDALTPEVLKEQKARLKRAAKREPLLLSSASGQGVQEALRTLLAVIDESRVTEEEAALPVSAPAEWRP
jgi:GTP-binding protein